MIIHKIVEDRAEQDLVDAYLAKHPETHLVGDFRGLRMVTDRCVLGVWFGLVGWVGCGVQTPPVRPSNSTD